jgi:type I restriction enzyme, R subunit
MKSKVRNEAAFPYPPDKQEKATVTVLQQAELLCANWVT